MKKSRLHNLYVFYATLLVTMLGIVLPLSVHAESVVWSTTIPGTMSLTESLSDLEDFVLNPTSELSVPVYPGHGAGADFLNPSVTLQYHAHMENPETGALISSGASIPVGTRIKFVFEPHTFNDIYWFATGQSYDSPYGDWRSNASAPPIACPDKDFVGKSQVKFGVPADIFASLTVNPPTKSLSGISNFDCDAPDSSGSRICTATTPGTANPTFTFGAPSTVQVPIVGRIRNPMTGKNTTPAITGAQATPNGGTYGYWYGRVRVARTNIEGLNLSQYPALKCGGGDNFPMYHQGDPAGPVYMLDVPAQSIPFNLTITGGDTPTENHAPTAPSLSNDNAACIVGSSYTISMTATDPEGDAIRYGIDWDNNGTIDQYVPATGFVPSGTTQMASRTFSIAGQKTVQVLAEDDQGHASAWSTLTFTCSQPSAASGSTDNQDQGQNGQNDQQNDQSNNTNDQNAGDGNFNGGNDIIPPEPVLDLRVIPSVVSRGSVSHVNWSASNVVSCTVSAQNGDGWSGLQSPVGGETTSPITERTTYTLSCRDSNGDVFTKQASVSILPIFNEI